MRFIIAFFAATILITYADTPETYSYIPVQTLDKSFLSLECIVYTDIHGSAGVGRRPPPGMIEATKDGNIYRARLVRVAADDITISALDGPPYMTILKKQIKKIGIKKNA